MISPNSTYLVLISLILCHITTNLFFLRGYRHSEREQLRQQTLDNSWTNAFGFGSIAIKASTNYPKQYNGGPKMLAQLFEIREILLRNVKFH